MNFHRDPAFIALPRLYRFFDSRRYAEQFVGGRILVSTLERCRNTEDTARADRVDGRQDYLLRAAFGSAGDPAFDEMTRRAGVDTQGARDWTVSSIRRGVQVEDAFILCMTSRLDAVAMSHMGSHCVEIFEPDYLFVRLSTSIRDRHASNDAAAGVVTYRDQTYEQLEAEPGPLGFVKRAQYKHEHEVRFLWHLNTPTGIRPDIFECGDLSRACRVI